MERTQEEIVLTSHLAEAAQKGTTGADQSLRQHLEQLSAVKRSELRMVALIGEMPSLDMQTIEALFNAAASDAYEGDRLTEWLISDPQLAEYLARGRNALKQKGFIIITAPFAS